MLCYTKGVDYMWETIESLPIMIKFCFFITILIALIILSSVPYSFIINKVSVSTKRKLLMIEDQVGKVVMVLLVADVVILAITVTLMEGFPWN